MRPAAPVQQMLLQLPLPPPLREEMSGRKWRMWKQQWMDYVKVSRLSEQTQEYQAAVLRGCLGPAGFEIHGGLPFERAEHKNDTPKVLALLESYYVGKVNVTFERYKFRSRTQKEGESTMTYIGELRRLSHIPGILKCNNRSANS